MVKRCGGEAVLLAILTDAIDVVHIMSSDRRAMVVVARPYTITLKVTAFGLASAREFLRDIAAIAVRRCQIPYSYGCLMRPCLHGSRETRVSGRNLST